MSGRRRVATIMTLACAVAAAQVSPPKRTPVPATKSTQAAHRPPVPVGAASFGDLKYPELRPITAPAVESVTLANGLRVFFWENHELPLVNGTVFVRTGTAFDPPEKTGLAALTAEVLLQGGTPDRPGDDLSKQFEDLGADVQMGLTENSFSITFSALRENSAAVLDMLKTGITAPAMSQDRIDLAKVRARNAIAQRNDDPSAILRREFLIAMYGKASPYSAQVEYANLDRINRADLVGFHQRYFFPKNTMLWMEGDFDTAAMKTQVAALFEDWKAEQAAPPNFPATRGPAGGEKYLAVKKNVTQSFFAVGQAGGDYQDKDYPALEILCGILGGGPHSRLHQRLAGAVDGLSVAWSPAFGHPGMFEVTGTITNPFLTPRVLQTVSEELRKMQGLEVSDQELRTAKGAVINSLLFAFENQLSLLPQMARFSYYNLPADYMQQSQKALEAVTRADVLRVAKDRLDPARMTTVVVGNPTAFETPLESLGGPVIPIDLAIPPPKPEASLGDAVSQRKGRQILAQAQQAIGGADKLAAVTDYVEELSYQFDASAGGVSSSMKERWMAPANLRQDTVIPTGKYSVYCDGKTGWVANSGGSNALVDVGLKQMQASLFRTLYPLLLSDRTPGRKINAIDDHTVEISDGAGQIVKLVFDSTGMLQNLLYDAPTVNGPVPVIEAYSDFREVNGLKLPFKVAITVGGKKYQDETVTSRQLNTGLKLADLVKRP